VTVSARLRGVHHAPAGGGPAYVVQDTFTGADGTLLTAHTGETGATWTKVTGVGFLTNDMEIRSNRARGLGNYGREVASGVPATAEYDVQADIYVASVSDAAGVVGRCASSGDSCYLAQYDSTSGAWQLYETVGYTLLGSFSQSLSVTQTYTIKLQVRNATKKVFIDGVERISSADNSITAKGSGGIQFGVTSETTGLHVDNFTVVNA
jgi:hypothetical protein